MKEDIIKTGKIIKSHGYEGRMVCLMEPLKTGAITRRPEWIFIDRHQEQVPYRIEDFVVMDEMRFLIKVKGIDGENVKKVVNSDVFLETEYLDLTEKDPLLLLRPEGWIVRHRGRPVGIVTGLIDNNSQTLLEVDYQGDSIFIPFVDAYILEINKEEKAIDFDLPEGLLEL